MWFENMNKTDFVTTLKKAELVPKPISIQTLWVNITKRCNQDCIHCHVNASPDRMEQMNLATIERCLEVIANLECCETLDITGGAPELHPHFDYMVVEARKLNKRVIVRHNLTITSDGDPHSGMSKEYLPYFFAENNVEILASLPHYTEHLTDRIRGTGVFKKSIQNIRQLNALGYGIPDTGFLLNLVHNCDGPISPAERIRLEAEFRKELSARHGLRFNSLITVTNMPIGRFRSGLRDLGALDEYTTKLLDNFNPVSVSGLACRHLISVGCDGRLYDCDFNQMLEMEITTTASTTIVNFDISVLLERRIRFGNHCFGCTAGGGSR